MTASTHAGPLAGLLVLDLSRILAGPSLTQTLGDLGAEVIKIERPGAGDDTRGWGPPFLRDAAGRETRESAYYLAYNRNKRSLAVDLDSAAGQTLIRDLAARADILVENFKVGGLVQYGLDYESLRAVNPRLVYCSVTGFGQTGPGAARAGYDYLVQGEGGLMSITGEPDAMPVKVGVAVCDVIAGLHGAVAILAALRHRDATGAGQHIDVALLDAAVATLGNQAQGYLTGGEVPPRIGNAHPYIMPYNVFATADGHVILAVGNDSQFGKFCALAGAPDLAADPRFARNADRVRNRTDLQPILETLLAARTTGWWMDELARVGVPAAPINRIDAVFRDPQVQARGMTVTLPHPVAATGAVELLSYPVKLSATPATHRHAPPTLGQDSDAVLRDVLGLDAARIADLRAAGVVG